MKTLYGEFYDWLGEQHCRLTMLQIGIAQSLLGLPSRSGKSWLIDMLYRFDNRKKGKMSDYPITNLEDTTDEELARFLREIEDRQRMIAEEQARRGRQGGRSIDRLRDQALRRGLDVYAFNELTGQLVRFWPTGESEFLIPADMTDGCPLLFDGKEIDSSWTSIPRNEATARYMRFVNPDQSKTQTT